MLGGWAYQSGQCCPGTAGRICVSNQRYSCPWALTSKLVVCHDGRRQPLVGQSDQTANTAISQMFDKTQIAICGGLHNTLRRPFSLPECFITVSKLRKFLIYKVFFCHWPP